MAKNVKPDVVLKRFWSDNEHFADLFNAVVFNGEQILNPECLEERNVTEAELIEWKDKGKTIERMRDIVKKSAFGVDFVILGIENQMKVHYGMPLRVMLYDGLQYLNECNEIIDDNAGAD